MDTISRRIVIEVDHAFCVRETRPRLSAEFRPSYLDCTEAAHSTFNRGIE